MFIFIYIRSILLPAQLGDESSFFRNLLAKQYIMPCVLSPNTGCFRKRRYLIKCTLRASEEKNLHNYLIVITNS
jgi:hypothetical protein